MNFFTCILLVCAIAALLDKAVGTKFGLAESVDVGLSTMGSTMVAVLGVSSVGICFVSNHAEAVAALTDVLPFDPSMILGFSLCPEMGAFSLTKQMTDNHEILVLNGLVIPGLLGQTISFQFPVFMTILDKHHHPTVITGFIIGFIMIPIGFIIAALMLRMRLSDFISEFIPVLIICIILCLGMFRAREITMKAVSAFAKVIQVFIYVLLCIAIIGVFIPSLAYSKDYMVEDALNVILQCTIIICGAVALSNTAIRIFRKQLNWLAIRLGINEVSVIACLLNCINSLASLPLYDKMDEKGKLMHAAFSVSGAYFLGGQMGYVASIISKDFDLAVYMISKVVCGFISMAVAAKLYSVLIKEIQIDRAENSY